jgi:hypothetical protein
MKTRFLAILMVTSMAMLAGCKKEETVSETATETSATATSSTALSATTTTFTPPATTTVTLKFTGIVHLNGTATNHRTVIVPNLISASHVPLLLAEPKYVVGNDLPTTGLQTLKNADGDVIKQTSFRFAPMTPGIDIDLIASKLKPSGSLTFSEAGDKNNPPGGLEEECPKLPNVTKESLHWLTRLSAAVGDPSATVKPEYLLPVPATSDVVTRVEINDGAMKAEAGATSYAYTVNGTVTHRQAVSSFLNYTFTAELDANGQFTLMGKSFDGKTSAPIAKFTPDPETNTIEICVANAKQTDFFDPPGVSMSSLPHLDLYFKILNTTQPVPPTTSKSRECGGVGNVDCGPDRTP